MNRTMHSGNWLETLERRQMFAASTVAPHLIGTYSGMTSDSNEKSPGTMIAIIQTQSSSGRVTGLVETKFPHEHTHESAFTGKIAGNYITVNTGTTTIKIKIIDSGHVLRGSYTFQSSNDNSVGSFDLTRTTK